MTPPPQRIVSLVPSLTEALFSLGLGERVVGVTDWCVHPAEGVAPLPKVGGTKNPSLARIRELAPDLVIANQEENRERDVEKLRSAGIEVLVTYPRSVAEGVAVLRELAELGADPDVVAACLDPVEQAFRAASEVRPAEPVPCFCPIWKDPWMAVGAGTYADDLIGLCGGANVFSFRQERRYPVITIEEIVQSAPEVILLPDEPYAFGERDVLELSVLPVPAAESGRIHRIDGTLVSWYGPRIGQAIQRLRSLLAP
jgi:ABC-type hemin transport system substrate-binding protein